MLDPRVPREILERKLLDYASCAPPAQRLPIASRGEAASLALAVLLLIGATLFLASLSFGVFLILLALALLYVRVHEAQDRARFLRIDAGVKPKVAKIAKVCAFRLDLPEQLVYLKQDENPNAYCAGFWGKHWIVLHSTTIDLCRPEELAFVLGHEMGHVKRQHTTWLTLTSQGRRLRIPLLSEGLKIIFNNWLLRAEYAADRAGLLACRTLDGAIGALVKLHHWDQPVKVEKILKDTDQLLQDPVARFGEYFGDHPYLASRIRALRTFHSELKREGTL